MTHLNTPDDAARGRQVRIGHTPDADDAFMFFGFATGQAEVAEHQIVHVLHDIQTLNVMAAGDDPLEVTAMSVNAFLDLQDRYELLEVGSSVGRGYGPTVVTRGASTVIDLAGKRIALPGEKTTATLAARALLPGFEEVHLPFEDIPDAVLNGDVDAGVLIHEVQLTYEGLGLHLVCDLGERFARHTGGLPLPLGVNCVRRELPPDLKRAIAAGYRHSVEVALAQRDQAVAYSSQFGRGASRDLLDRFVGMYVNADSLAMDDEVRRAIAVLDKCRHNPSGQPAA